MTGSKNAYVLIILPNSFQALHSAVVKSILIIILIIIIIIIIIITETRAGHLHFPLYYGTPTPLALLSCPHALERNGMTPNTQTNFWITRALRDQNAQNTDYIPAC